MEGIAILIVVLAYVLVYSFFYKPYLSPAERRKVDAMVRDGYRFTAAVDKVRALRIKEESKKESQ